MSPSESAAILFAVLFVAAWLAFLPWMVALGLWRGVLWPDDWPRATRYVAIAALGLTWTLVVVDGAMP